MKWIKIIGEDTLPPEGRYVLARHNRGTWRDSSDQDNVNCVVVKLRKGISMKEREVKGKIWPNDPRFKEFQFGDEHGNNLTSYQWGTFGLDSFFGQTITHWTKIGAVNED